MRVCVYVGACVRVRVRVCWEGGVARLCTCMLVYVCVFMYLRARACVCPCVCMCVPVCTYLSAGDVCVSIRAYVCVRRVRAISLLSRLWWYIFIIYYIPFDTAVLISRTLLVYM